MTELKMILSESFNLASSPDGLPVMKLLTALFSLCECCTYLNAWADLLILGHAYLVILVHVWLFLYTSAYLWIPSTPFH